MDRRRMLAFTCFVANAVLGAALAIVYLASPAAMARDEAAARAVLPALGPGEQALLVAAVRVGGAVAIAAAAAWLFLRGRPIGAGERWAATAVVGEQYAMALGAAYAVATVLVLAGALPAWGAALASLLLPVAGWAVASPHPRIRSLVPHRAR
jgi:hypothetical protein